VKVDWPPKLQCTPLKFYNVQKGAPPKPSTCRWYHTVQPGQTLSGLAAWYGVSVNALMAANGIANPNTVYAGRKLCIP
jgi:LysM repeat protein